MTRLLASITLLLTATPALAEPCLGLPRDWFEQRIMSAEAKIADRATELSLMGLWSAGNRPELPAVPTEITIYRSEIEGLPAIVGYHTGNCTIAYLAIYADELAIWLFGEGEET